MNVLMVILGGFLFLRGLAGVFLGWSDAAFAEMGTFQRVGALFDDHMVEITAGLAIAILFSERISKPKD